MNIWDFFNEDDKLSELFKKWKSEAKKDKIKKAKLDEYQRKLEKEATPFRRK